MRSGPVSRLPRRFTFGGKRSAVTFSSLTAEINKVVDNTQHNSKDKKINAIKALIQEYVNVKGTENKSKFETCLKCCIGLRNRQDLAGEVARDLGKEIATGYEKDLEKVQNFLKENKKLLMRRSSCIFQLSEIDTLTDQEKNEKTGRVTINEEVVEINLNDYRKILVEEKKPLDDIIPRYFQQKKDFLEKYGIPHHKHIDVSDFLDNKSDAK